LSIPIVAASPSPAASPEATHASTLEAEIELPRETVTGRRGERSFAVLSGDPESAMMTVTPQLPLEAVPP
jgi:hypothetical protein